MQNQNNIAVFWDFENLHASIMNAEFGPNWFHVFKYKAQPDILDIDAIMDRIKGLGNVVLNRAYANWQWLGRYTYKLNLNAFDLVQIYPRGYGMKNGADIRMAVDVTQTLALYPHIDTVVLVSGDSDFVSVAQLVRRAGKQMIGLGARNTSNEILIRNCNLFLIYENIVNPAAGQAQPEEQHEEVDNEALDRLVVQAMTQLGQNLDTDWIQRVRIKPMLQRLDPAFDEQGFGFAKFGDFLASRKHLLNYRHRDGEQEPEYALREGVVQEQQPTAAEAPAARGDHWTRRQYQDILSRQKIKFLDYDTMLTGLEVYSDMREAGETYPSNQALDARVHRHLLDMGYKDATLTDARRIRSLMYKCFIFVNFGEAGFGFQESVGGFEDMVQRFHFLVVKRIADNITEELDGAVLSELVRGDDKLAPILTDIYNKYQARNATTEGSFDGEPAE